MNKDKLLNYLKELLNNVPSDWLNLTTHRLDIYNEELAKTEFLEAFENLYSSNHSSPEALQKLPTAYDYIRLGHPLSTVLEWFIAKLNHTNAERVISFSSRTIPIMAVLRKNQLDNKNTRIVYIDQLPSSFDPEEIKRVYGYSFKLEKANDLRELEAFDGSTLFVSNSQNPDSFDLNDNVDFYINNHTDWGSVLLINGDRNQEYVAAIQHVRRRETIAMTPANCMTALQHLSGSQVSDTKQFDSAKDQALVVETIRSITGTQSKAIIGSSGLSIQYAIMMGLIDNSFKSHSGKAIKFIVPTNCYGGTNDQARRVAACIDQVEVLDWRVDGDSDMVQSLNHILDQVAKADAIPFIIAEIPTNPRVEVPNMDELKKVLSQTRTTADNHTAVDPVFILDQTFCPNIQFLKEEGYFESIKAISYVSGSKFPSGGKCTAGYCVANKEAEGLVDAIEKHLILCDNEATDLQIAILAEQMPSMIQRIAEAYLNTREFVNFIKQTLPTAKINFVSEELAKEGFTPSVFSLDLPTKGEAEEEREAYKRGLNNKLITMMISELPNDSKYCVSYGQLKGCYWTIPATSTQGTTKESDKDYIARVSVSPELDLERHKEVFTEFVKGI
ncbi:cystathionine beta-synthase [Ekhidna sp.]|uniref:cystathionine beta-synthase n=1 Tax=Ekhidna sp. TaxID=2608089 RepID=UPI003B50CB6B